MPADSSKPGTTPQPRSATLIAAALLLAALALVVLYTSRRAFLSPAALVVVAAIGVVALLLQLRLRPALTPSSAPSSSGRGSLWTNLLGIVFSVATVFSDVLHLGATLMLIVALAAVVSFAISGIIVLNALRKPRI